MVHTSIVSAAAAATSAARFKPPAQLSSAASFDARAPILSPYDERRPLSSDTRRLSSHRYHTFLVVPPKTPSDVSDTAFAHASAPASAPPSDDEPESPREPRRDGSRGPGRARQHDDSTPLPWRQLALLALLSLAEQTALNSISPYLPTMVASFPDIPASETGLYVGILASAFALAQLLTNLLWGYASDTVGRKPVMLLGTALLGACFALFGFVRSYATAVAVHVAMGLLNGNAAVVPTCLGEITNRSNQSRAFTWLPVMYSIGGITGPALGGLLVGDVQTLEWPFLAPNLCAAALLAAAVVILAVWFEETLDGGGGAAAGAWTAWLERLCGCGRPCRRWRRRGRLGSWSSRWPTRESGARAAAAVGDSESSEDEAGGGDAQALPQRALVGEADGAGVGDSKAPRSPSAFRQLLNRTTLTVLVTYLVFQLSNISFNSLYPIFASAAPPSGRGLGPGTIGLSLSFAGLVTIVFQVFVFQPLKARMGNLGSYRAALLGIALSMVMMPWVGYLDGGGEGEEAALARMAGSSWLVYAELGFVLVLKNVCAIGGLSSVMLLITNSAPSHETLGTLNGVAQSLSAAGRSIGPFLSGGLFTLSTHVEPKGELLAWGLFGGIAVIGWLGTLVIRGDGLESEDWVVDDDDGSDQGGEETQQSG